MRHLIRLVSCLALGIAWSCSGGGGLDDPTYSDTDLYNPGMGNQGNIGPMNQYVPEFWSYLFYRETFGELIPCIDTGLCGHGGAAVKFGTVTSEDTLVYVLTSNYLVDDTTTAGGGPRILVPIIASGVQHDAVELPASPSDKKLRLAFQYAFLSSRDVDGDSALVRVFQDDDSLAAQVVLRVLSSQLGADIPLRSGGCGTERIPPDPFNTDGTETTYGRCSDWRDAEFDISDFRGHFFTTQFIVGEGSADTDHGIALLIRQVRIQQED